MQAKCQMAYYSLIFSCPYQVMSEKAPVDVVEIIGQLFNCVFCWQ